MDDILTRIVNCIGPRHGAKKQLAEHLQIHPNVITNWLSGRNKSYMRYLEQIANYFGVSVNYLLTGEQEKPDIPEDAEPSDDLIKYALFGGAATDAQLEEVKRFAQFIQERDKGAGS